jgi:hypothetical protein
MSYHGRIRVGMGVQKRYTGSSFAWDWKGDDNTEGVQASDKRNGRTGRTWVLMDPMERWRKGLHPLSGQRGNEFSRIAYYR